MFFFFILFRRWHFVEKCLQTFFFRFVFLNLLAWFSLLQFSIWKHFWIYHPHKQQQQHQQPNFKSLLLNNNYNRSYYKIWKCSQWIFIGIQFEKKLISLKNKKKNESDDVDVSEFKIGLETNNIFRCFEDFS